jgi:hypothetical protein
MSGQDLYVLAADADAKALLDEILGSRHRSFGMREISFYVERSTSRDWGMVIDGPERVRGKKALYNKLVLIWDYHGSGWETKNKKVAPPECQSRIIKRLAGVSWKDNSAAIILVPELEEWLWRDPESIRQCLELSAPQMDEAIQRYAKKKNKKVEHCKSNCPKELLRELFLRKPLPEDFKNIASRANLDSWRRSSSFNTLVTTLATWFPA